MKPSTKLLGGIFLVVLLGFPTFFVVRMVYRAKSFSASLDEQVVLLEVLDSACKERFRLHPDTSALNLRNVWPNACFGAYFMPESQEDLDAMRDLTRRLRLIVDDTNQESIVESVKATYKLLQTTGYNPDFISRHRVADLEWLEQALDDVAKQD